MFNSLIRYYNQNREKIIKVIVIIIAVIALIQILNQMAKKQAEAKKENTQNIQSSSIISNNQSSDKSANKIQTDSIINSGTITTQTASKNQTKIKNFVQFCNNGDVNSAYSMLSQNCKDELFETAQEFKTKYVDKIFLSKKQYNIENWISSSLGETYKVTYINDDTLQTGTISSSIQDYITIDSNQELNVLRYISNVQINKTGSNSVATINIIDKDVYKDYEIYNIKVTNNSPNTIMLNRRADNDRIYVTYSRSNTKYTAYITEIYEGNLILNIHQTKYISIKINKKYDGNLAVEKMVFADIIKNKTKFDENKENYTEISAIQVDM